MQFRAAARGACTTPRRGKSKSPSKAGAKAKPIKVRKGEKVAVVLSGGNPRIAKADGDADEGRGDHSAATSLRWGSGRVALGEK